MISVSTGGTQGNGSIRGYSVSDDGRYVVFGSGSVEPRPRRHEQRARRVPPGPPVRDDGARERLRRRRAGGWYSLFPWISGNGRYIAFHSNASNLVPDKTNGGANDIYVRDRVSGTTERVSLSNSGVQGNSDSIVPWISSDGRFIELLQQGLDARAGSFERRGRRVPPRPRISRELAERSARATEPARSCPCSNYGIIGHGCQSSVGTNGATLLVHGNASLAADTLKLTTSGQRATALSLVVQGASW
jgi:hypothetical protein